LENFQTLVGQRKPPHSTVSAWARELSENPVHGRFLGLYVKLRYGQPEVDSVQLEQLKGLLEEVKAP
jgi:hypothetical protein